MQIIELYKVPASIIRMLPIFTAKLACIFIAERKRTMHRARMTIAKTPASGLAVWNPNTRFLLKQDVVVKRKSNGFVPSKLAELDDEVSIILFGPKTPGLGC